MILSGLFSKLAWSVFLLTWVGLFVESSLVCNTMVFPNSLIPWNSCPVSTSSIRASYDWVRDDNGGLEEDRSWDSVHICTRVIRLGKSRVKGIDQKWNKGKKAKSKGLEEEKQWPKKEVKGKKQDLEKVGKEKRLKKKREKRRKPPAAMEYEDEQQVAGRRKRRWWAFYPHHYSTYGLSLGDIITLRIHGTWVL